MRAKKFVYCEREIFATRCRIWNFMITRIYRLACGARLIVWNLYILLRFRFWKHIICIIVWFGNFCWGCGLIIIGRWFSDIFFGVKVCIFSDYNIVAGIAGLQGRGMIGKILISYVSSAVGIMVTGSFCQFLFRCNPI